jgi:hypothetical protein
MTKKQAAARNEAFRRARAEDRVIRYTSYDAMLNCEQYTFVSYPTVEQAARTLQVQLARIAAGESTYIGACIAPCCVPNAWGACAEDCLRAAKFRRP